jgi:cell filamentation protein
VTLAGAERELTRIAASEIELSPPPYDLTYLQGLHRHLFQDVYDWAGEIRSIDISKGSTRFCKVDRIAAEAEKVLAELAKVDWLQGMNRPDLVKAAAMAYGDLNMVHPFREGNGRAQRLLFEHLIICAGRQIDWGSVTQQEWLQANVDAVVCDYTGLERIFDKSIGDLIGE